MWRLRELLVYANSVNFSFDPIAYLDGLDPTRIGAIHLAGGCWIETGTTAESGDRRYLDDHLHDVPDPVYLLLVEVGARVQRPLTVVLERDGRFPSMRGLLWQLDRARAALAEGRRLRAARYGEGHAPSRFAPNVAQCATGASWVIANET